MKNLKLHLEDRPGALAEMGEILGHARVSLEGGGMFVVEGVAVANFLVDDAAAARKALEAAGIDVVQEDEVVLQKLDQDEPGQLGKLLRRMADAHVNVATQYSDHHHQLVLVVDNLSAAQAVSDAWTRERHAARHSGKPLTRKRTHHYRVKVAWTGNQGSGTSGYTAYGREHEISGEEKVSIGGSSDPAFRGDRTRYNPEELLLASASACHMLSYLHLCAVHGIAVLSYEDRATGEMEEGAGTPGAFVRVDLHPTITIGASSDAQQAESLHQPAHRECFIANSLKVPVLVHPEVRHDGANR